MARFRQEKLNPILVIASHIGDILKLLLKCEAPIPESRRKTSKTRDFAEPISSPTKHLKSDILDFLTFQNYYCSLFKKLSHPFWNLCFEESIFMHFEKFPSFLEKFALEALKIRY